MDFEIGYTGENFFSPSDGKINCLLNKIILAKLRQILALFPNSPAYHYVHYIYIYI